jgi:hypothetical protein
MLFWVDIAAETVSANSHILVAMYIEEKLLIPLSPNNVTLFYTSIHDSLLQKI